MEDNSIRFGFYFLLAFVLFSVSPVFANANISTWVDSAASVSYVNTNTNLTTLNITIFANDSAINISAINVSVIGTAGAGNISVIRILNSTSDVVGINSSVASSPSFINLTNNLVLAANQNGSLIIVYEISSGATSTATIGANITSPADFTSNDTIDTANFPIASSLPQIQDVHATASISPNYVDTNVTNQTFIYTITPTGSDGINETSIIIPTGYSIVKVMQVKQGSTVLTYPTNYSNTTLSGRVNITLNSSTTAALVINFTINTNISSVSTLPFNATISGSNLTVINTTVTSDATNVTTQVLVNITQVTATKNTAYLNGTDWWEFNITLNITSPSSISGSLQMKMENWTDGTTNISLTSGSTYYATLRNESSFNIANKINIMNNYNSTDGVSFSSVNRNSLVTVVLRMIIPCTCTKISSNWWTTFSMLFRTDP